MINIGHFICSCGRPHGAESPRCKAQSHKKANDRASQLRLAEATIQRISQQYGPAAGRLASKPAR